MKRSEFLASVFGAPVVMANVLEASTQRPEGKPILVCFEVPIGIRYPSDRVTEMREQIQAHLGPDVRFVIMQDGITAKVLG